MAWDMEFYNPVDSIGLDTAVVLSQGLPHIHANINFPEMQQENGEPIVIFTDRAPHATTGTFPLPRSLIPSIRTVCWRILDTCKSYDEHGEQRLYFTLQAEQRTGWGAYRNFTMVIGQGGSEPSGNTFLYRFVTFLTRVSQWAAEMRMTTAPSLPSPAAPHVMAAHNDLEETEVDAVERHTWSYGDDVGGQRFHTTEIDEEARLA